MKHLGGILLFVLTIIMGCGEKHAPPQSLGIVVGVADLEAGSGLADTVGKAIQEVYGFCVVYLPGQKIPQHFFVSQKSPRYRADSIIQYLKKAKPDTMKFIVGVTSFDISATKEDAKGNVLKPEYKYADWGVFGLGYMPGPSCIVSSFRLRAGGEQFYERIKKVAVHELGHNLGLNHCTNACVMQDAVEKLSTIDDEPLELCRECRKQLGN